jgi:hypothetical protein
VSERTPGVDAEGRYVGVIYAVKVLRITRSVRPSMLVEPRCHTDHPATEAMT